MFVCYTNLECTAFIPALDGDDADPLRPDGFKESNAPPVLVIPDEFLFCFHDFLLSYYLCYIPIIPNGFLRTVRSGSKDVGLRPLRF